MEKKPEPEYINYLACPFCGRSVTLGQLSDKTFKSYSIEWALFQFRQPKGGRGRGGFFWTKQGLSIKQMLKNPKTKPLAQKLIERLKIIHKAWKRSGLL